MKTLLRADFPNGFFGDPALYVWDITRSTAFLFDCGDLSLLSPRQLGKVTHVFLSHCHMDHFFGFDQLLRVHMGVDKTISIVGPPETSDRVAGKLRGYTWNLIHDQNLEFQVTDLDVERGRKRLTRFHARDRFRAGTSHEEHWHPSESVLDAEIYQVKSVMLDHRTPSMAYSIEEKHTVSVSASAMRELGLRPGPWINQLKTLFLMGGLESSMIEVITEPGANRVFRGPELAQKILIPRQRQKMAYATDGAASPENKERLLGLIQGADVFYAETCFLERDRALADETKHFTARFMGELAREAHVKKIVPFHFSKRYLEEPDLVLREVSDSFGMELEIALRKSA